jgi:hypothetical protein
VQTGTVPEHDASHPHPPCMLQMLAVVYCGQLTPPLPSHTPLSVHPQLPHCVSFAHGVAVPLQLPPVPASIVPHAQPGCLEHAGCARPMQFTGAPRHCSVQVQVRLVQSA